MDCARDSTSSGKRRLASLMVTGAVLGLSACGGSDEEQIREQAAKFVEAAEAYDEKATCDLLNTSAVSQLQTWIAFHEPCVEVVRVQLGTMRELAQSTRFASNAAIEISGDQATLSGDGETVRLQQEEGEWLISGFGSE